MAVSWVWVSYVYHDSFDEPKAPCALLRLVDRCLLGLPSFLQDLRPMKSEKFGELPFTSCRHVDAALAKDVHLLARSS